MGSQEGEMRVERDGAALAYEDLGAGDPPLLLVHGWGTDRSLFAPLATCFRGRNRVVAVDVRGFGESDAPARPYTIGGCADDLAFIAQRLGLSPAVVVGHSMGGLIALDFAARHGHRVAATVLLEAMVVAPDVIEGLRPILAGVRAPDHRDFVGRLITYLAGPRFDPELRGRLVKGIQACSQQVLTAAMEAIIGFDSASAAARITSPLLYVGTDVRYANEEHLRALCPQLRTERLAGCGHYFPVEAPDELHQVLAGFLGQLTPQ
jgi:pimeloyl-ACP methyl ester carboxylesterase